MTEFEGVVPALGQALNKRGYSVLTSVQQAIIAPELRNADVLVSAQTGSGKTVAFGLALETSLLDGAERFAPAAAPLALAVAPTRELALQVKRELEWLYEMTGARVASCVGGMDMRDERRALARGAHIVVGTPGRLRDHIERGSFDTTALKAVVLDEADEMLDLGFREDLEYILDAAPTERRTMMFSATVPRPIANLARRYQRDAVRVSTTEELKQHLDIEYRAMTVAPNDRENAIVNVLRYFEPQTALVFCATRATVNHMTSRFTNRGFSVVALSGELSQAERTHALQAIRDGRARVCIATDVAARGIDLPNLDLVIHADIPKNRENLVHRSGRTGRAGRKGICALIVPHNARRQTERLLGNAKIEAIWAKSPSIDEVMQRDRERMLEDASLSEPLNDDETALTGELLARYGAEQIAAAFLRLHRAGNPTPEELLDTAPVEEKKKRYDDFKDSVWFSLPVGRKDAAEPRWLLPMLCRAGHITKNEIGAIRIQQEETHVELTADCVERFLEAVGPSGKVEDSIVISRLEGAPAPRDSGHKPFAKRVKPYTARKRAAAAASNASGPEPRFADKRKSAEPAETKTGETPRDKTWKKSKGRKADYARKPAAPFETAAPPADTPSGDTPTAEKPSRNKKAWAKPKGKKSHKSKFNPKFAKSGGKKYKAGTGGNSPLKRKKPGKKFD